MIAEPDQPTTEEPAVDDTAWAELVADLTDDVEETD
jgi:hypothetical protein